MARSELPTRSGRREPRPERQAAFHVGISAESRAAAFLIAKGFRILARRWRSPLGEIDIVARRRQRRRIAAAAEIWLAANPDDSIRDIRFDAILVAPGKIPQHIPAAFDV